MSDWVWLYLQTHIYYWWQTNTLWFDRGYKFIMKQNNLASLPSSLSALMSVRDTMAAIGENTDGYAMQNMYMWTVWNQHRWGSTMFTHIMFTVHHVWCVGLAQLFPLELMAQHLWSGTVCVGLGIFSRILLLILKRYCFCLYFEKYKYFLHP